MANLRTYGKGPYRIAVIHGGPGAIGEMAPVAEELASNWDILEPFQTSYSIEGQIEELASIIEETGDPPIILIGFSWGAWLSYLVAAKHPNYVKKLILIGSGPFEEQYTESLMKTRMQRLSENEREEFHSIIKKLEDPTTINKQPHLTRLGTLSSKTDYYNPKIVNGNNIELTDASSDLYQRVWTEAAELRRTGELLEFGYTINCPVVAIHGDYDPHPIEGVQKPLSSFIEDFRVIILESCGHKPWIEQHASKEFYLCLKNEIDEDFSHD